MAAYGRVALRAVALLRQGTCSAPEDAWRTAVAEIYAHSPSSQTKGCPRGTFLGLCGSGVIKGIPAGNYTRSAKNKHYGLRALELLRANPSLANDQASLWERVTSGAPIKANYQMEVVASLWNNGFLAK